MRTIKKKDLRLLISAPNIEELRKHLLSKYMKICELRESDKYFSKLGKCYDVINANGIIKDQVIIDMGRGKLFAVLS